MVKKVLALAFGLVLTFGAMAQGAANPIVPQSDIQFWTGSGSNRGVVAVTWPTSTGTNIGIAWGVQWNGNNVSIANIMDTIAAYDNNLTIEHGNTTYTLVYNISYSNATESLTLSGEAGWWCYNWKDAEGTSKQSANAGDDMMADGDFVDWLNMNSTTYETQAADTMIMATATVPEDAEIAAEDIVYWVGEGENKVVFAINWADTALAWGYKFSTDSVYVSEIIGAIVRNDSRLRIEGDSTYVTDFVYADANITDSLHITPHDPMDYSIYFNMQVNHVSSMVGAAGRKVGNGDFVKFADTYVAVKADSTWIADWGGYWDYTYVYPMTIHPVSIPVGIAGVEAVSVMVWPNPTTSLVNVSVSRPMQAELYDLSGRQVAAYSFAEGSNMIDLSALQNGVYMLRAEGSVSKIVKR